MSLIWEIYQQGRIYQAETAAESVAAKAESVRGEIAVLRRQVEQLALSCQAMWELLREHSDLEEKDLLAKISEVDLRDGQEDGKMATQQLVCPACNRAANTLRRACVFCGEPLFRPNAFE